jgi:hypothetical protein
MSQNVIWLHIYTEYVECLDQGCLWCLKVKLIENSNHYRLGVVQDVSVALNQQLNIFFMEIGMVVIIWVWHLSFTRNSYDHLRQ